MATTIGFIGSGTMARAMMSGIISSGAARPEDITASDAQPEALAAATATLRIQTATDNAGAARGRDIVFICVKPFAVDGVIREIAPVVGGAVVASIAAGRTLASMQAAFAGPVKLVRLMPNTPAMVREGMTAVCPNSLITGEDLARLTTILRSFGRCDIIPENLMDAEVALAGSGPAYVFMFIEAMADAAVAEGMPRDKAYLFAAQTVLGSAKMVLETGLHPGQLKDMVSSPAGTTIEAVAALERGGFRSAVIEAVRVCAGRSRALGRPEKG